MIKPVVGVYNLGFDKARALVYYNGQWREAVVKVRADNSWNVVGGEGILFLNFVDSEGNVIFDADEKAIQIKGE